MTSLADTCYQLESYRFYSRAHYVPSRLHSHKHAAANSSDASEPGGFRLSYHTFHPIWKVHPICVKLEKGTKKSSENSRTIWWNNALRRRHRATHLKTRVLADGWIPTLLNVCSCDLLTVMANATWTGNC